MESHHENALPLKVEIGGEQGQWSPHTNTITYELKSLENEVSQEAPALAVTTRARKGKTPMKIGVEDQKEYFSDEAPNLSELDRVAKVGRRATRELERENVILHDRERSNIVHDLEDQKFLWMNLMVLEMPKWRRRVATICGPILTHSRPILLSDNYWRFHRWQGKLSRTECR